MEKEPNNDIRNLRRYLNGTYTASEIDDLSESLCNTQEKELLDRLAQEVWEEAENLPEPSEQRQDSYRQEAEMLLRPLLKPRKEHKRRTTQRRLLLPAIGMAASMLLVLGIAGLWSYLVPEQVEWLQTETTFGEKKEITLADGSCIILNACSKLQYPESFTGDYRDIKLNGEAYFKVAPDREKPFRIKTTHFGIEVLGTEFNVKSYPDDQIQSVEVESGKVQVDLPEDRIRLKKEEQIYMNLYSGEYNKKKNPENKVAVWRKGDLHFSQTPLHDVARELERKYHCQISFSEGQVFNHLISGEHENQSLESILESICYICGIHYQMNDRKIILYK